MRDRRCRNSFKVLALLLATLINSRLVEYALGEPETWFDPFITITGTEGVSRFGASLACSSPSINTSNSSLIAVGAPFEDNAQGVVYIYNPDAPSSPMQRITSESVGTPREFGTSVVFLKDFNGDLIDELAISQPNRSAGDSAIWIYQSTNSSPPYSRCASLSLAGSGWGDKMVSAQRYNPLFAATLIISEPGLTGFNAYHVSLPSIGSATCDIHEWTPLLSLPAMRRYQTAAELPLPASGDINLVFGAPSTMMGNSNGEIYTDKASGSPATLFRTGTMNELLGENMCASPLSDILAFTGATGQTIYVSSLTKNLEPDPNICSFAASVASLTDARQNHLTHLNTAFSSFLGGGTATFAVTQTGVETGGAIGLFSAHEAAGCTALKYFNNCVEDTSQQQGYVLSGGSECRASFNGSKVPMLLVGSPGFNSDKGRIDAIAQGSELADARPCSATATPTATPTHTPTQTATPTPSPNQSPAPSATPRTEEPPVPISAGQGGLPAPIVSPSERPGEVTITMPLVTLQQRSLTRLAKLLKISVKKMSSLVTAKQVQFTYILKIEERTSDSKQNRSNPQQGSVKEDYKLSGEVGTSSRTLRTRIIRTRNRIARQRIAAGRVYVASYQVEISVKGSKAAATTKSSPAVAFSG